MAETRLDTHSRKIDKLETAIVAIKSYETDQKVIIEHLSKIVCGNGQPGLDEQSRRHTSMLESHTKEINDLRGEVKELIKQFQPVFLFYKMGIWLFTILGGSVVALIWGILTHSVQITIP